MRKLKGDMAGSLPPSHEATPRRATGARDDEIPVPRMRFRRASEMLALLYRDGGVAENLRSEDS